MPLPSAIGKAQVATTSQNQMSPHFADRREITVAYLFPSKPMLSYTKQKWANTIKVYCHCQQLDDRMRKQKDAQCDLQTVQSLHADWHACNPKNRRLHKYPEWAKHIYTYWLICHFLSIPCISSIAIHPLADAHLTCFFLYVCMVVMHSSVYTLIQVCSLGNSYTVWHILSSSDFVLYSIHIKLVEIYCLPILLLNANRLYLILWSTSTAVSCTVLTKGKISIHDH